MGQEGQGSVPIDIHVTAADLLAQPVGSNWTSYNGDYSGRRFSSLQEINVGNVAQLRAAWVFHPGNSQSLEVTPVVVRGMMYVTSANDVFALDARSGRVVWHYQRPLSSGLLDDAAAHQKSWCGSLEKFCLCGNRRCPLALSRRSLRKHVVGRSICRQGQTLWRHQCTPGRER